MSDRRPGSERARLDPFVAVPDDAISPRDQRDLMSQPFFSLAKGRRTAPILYETGGIRVEVHGFPDYGMATIWDADVLILAASQIVAAADRGSQDVAFLPLHTLSAAGRDRPRTGSEPICPSEASSATTPVHRGADHDSSRRELAADAVLLDQ